MKLACLLSMLLLACAETTPAAIGSAVEAEPAVDREPAAEPALTAPEPVAEPALAAPEVALPRQLECVSAIDVKDGSVASSLRATLVLDGDAAHATLVSAPRFQSHDGIWSDDVEPSVREEALRATGPMTFGGADTDGVVLELTEHAPFFTAELQLDGASTELSCWDRVAIFGSSWSTQPLALARYDAAQGGCVGPDGTPAALNALPLEFVLETSHGECADLAGVSLNAGDYGVPDIVANLRGAALSGATVHFANLSGSFEGARLAALEYGYASVSGSIDAATELPGSGDCRVTASPWAGDSVTCSH